MQDIHASAKQLEIIELKLEIDSDKERKSTPKHETHHHTCHATTNYVNMDEARLNKGVALEIDSDKERKSTPKHEAHHHTCHATTN